MVFELTMASMSLEVEADVRGVNESQMVSFVVTTHPPGMATTSKEGW